MKYSNEMQAVLSKAGIKPENVMYLTIARNYLNRIKAGTKKVEFRAVTELYLKKLVKVNSKGEYVEEKPITHLLLQGGYSAESPRVLVELADWFIKESKEDRKGQPESTGIEDVVREAKEEGFTDNDEYLALVLGSVILSENFKG